MPTIYFVVFNQAEVLDFSATFDVFSMARIAMKRDVGPYDMKLLSVNGGQIVAVHGFKVVADHALDQITPAPDDLILVPGGGKSVIDAILGKPDTPEGAALCAETEAIVDWLRQNGPKASMVISICVGAFFPAKAGLFAGQTVTTHNGLMAPLEALVGQSADIPEDQKATVLPGARYTINDQPDPYIACSGGVSAGIDLAFALIELLWSVEARLATQKLMEYNGTTNFGAAMPDLPSPPCFP